MGRGGITCAKTACGTATQLDSKFTPHAGSVTIYILAEYKMTLSKFAFHLSEVNFPI